MFRGVPAQYGQEIVKRRFRLTTPRISLENKIVLDCGCGNGVQTFEFLKSGCMVIAGDIEFSNLKTFSEKLQSQHQQNVLPLQCDGARLPLPTESVDAVLCYEVLEHVPDESLQLSEIHRVLKPHGEFIISVPNKGWIFETHGTQLRFLPLNRVPFLSWLPRSLHRLISLARIYRKRDIEKLLTDHSFNIVKSLYITAPMDVVKIPWLKRLLRSTIFSGDTTSLTFLSTSVLVHCRKK